jgi:hypothetical protein
MLVSSYLNMDLDSNWIQFNDDSNRFLVFVVLFGFVLTLTCTILTFMNMYYIFKYENKKI